jgi:hypothetical protein
MFVYHPQSGVIVLEEKDLPQLCGSLHLGCDSVSFLRLAVYMVYLLHYITTCAKYHHQIVYFLFKGNLCSFPSYAFLFKIYCDPMDVIIFIPMIISYSASLLEALSSTWACHVTTLPVLSSRNLKSKSDS